MMSSPTASAGCPAATAARRSRTPVDRRVMITVEDEHGSAVEIIDLAILDQLDAEDRALLEDFANTVLEEIDWHTDIRSLHDARLALLAELTRRRADAAAYEREALRRGVLPL